MRTLVIHIILLGLLIASSVLHAQKIAATDLYQQLKEQDSLLFDAAFNQCDPVRLEKIFTEDFEFYHDKSGLTRGREEFMTPFKESCVNRDPNSPQPARRILIDDSLEVYPLKDQGVLYGAIQHGMHRFESLEGEEYTRGDTARFTHLWILEEGQWKLSRELSYDHVYQGDIK